MNFNAGNPWNETEDWQAASTNVPWDLTALGPLRLWLGLKSRDDQGTQFDLRAEVHKNGALAAAGETL